MANKHMRSHSNSLTIRGMLIENMRSFHTSSSMSNMEKVQCHELARAWNNWNSHTVQVGESIYKPSRKTIWQDLLKLTIHKPHDPPILFLVVTQRKRKYAHTKIYNQIFRAASFITAKTGNKCLSKGEKWANCTLLIQWNATQQWITDIYKERNTHMMM